MVLEEVLFSEWRRPLGWVGESGGAVGLLCVRLVAVGDLGFAAFYKPTRLKNTSDVAPH